MKRSFPKEKQNLFVGSLRHYHRTGAKSYRAWDAWVDEKSTHAKSINWLRIIVIVLAVLGLGGIIAGLMIDFF